MEDINYELLVKEHDPEFYNQVKDIVDSTPDLRPADTNSKMKNETWNPWRRLYDELAALPKTPDEEAENRSDAEALIMTVNDELDLGWMDKEFEKSLKHFILTYPVLFHLILKITDREVLEKILVAGNRLDLIEGPIQTHIKDLVLYAFNKELSNYFFRLIPKEWSWTRRGNKNPCIRDGLLSFGTYILLNCGGLSYYSGTGFDHNNDELYVDRRIYVQPPYWEYDDDDYDDGTSLVIVDLKLLKKLAKKTILLNREVILRQDGTVYHEYPKEWYNKPVKKNTKIQPPISSRQWIIVEKPFERIRIDSAIKDAPITVEDIFFACRALCKDSARYYESFKVIEDKDGILTMNVDINN